MQRHVIGFTGLAGAGKDTAATAMLGVLREHGCCAAIDSFAAPIRAISNLSELDPYDRENKEVQHTFMLDRFCDAFQYGIDRVLRGRLLDHERASLYAFTMEALRPYIWSDWDGERITLSPREFMQVLGTEGGQRLRQNLWVDLARERWLLKVGILLVPDVRFAHEMRVLDRLIVVTRPSLAPVNDHASEHLAARLMRGEAPESKTHMPIIRQMHNTGSLAKLQYRARKIAGRIARGQSW